MKVKRMVAVVALLAGLAVPRAQAADPADAACVGCHQAVSPALIESLERSPHRGRTDATGPPAPGCVTCHGRSVKHMGAPGTGEKGADRIFGHGPGAASPEIQNQTCLGCHSGRERQHWEGSAHEREGLICADCHNVHGGADAAAADATLDKQAAVETCVRCHTRQRAQIHYASSHPLRDGQMTCSDCHNPHGESAPGQLVAGLGNETCYRCHAEKRGPFLWEHPPVSEDCSLCHSPHGSNHPNLLSARTPWLCQQCHLAQFHPSTAYSGTGLPGDSRPSGAQSLLARDCLNCHAQVHGSNHPSGPRQTR